MNKNETLYWSISGEKNSVISFILSSEVSNKKIEGFDWVDAVVKIHTACFWANVNLTITLSDIISFLEQIKNMSKNLKGVARFSTIEDQINFLLEINRLGQINISGYLRESMSGRNELNFEITSDQTFLEKSILEINNLLSQLNIKTI